MAEKIRSTNIEIQNKLNSPKAKIQNEIAVPTFANPSSASPFRGRLFAMKSYIQHFYLRPA